MKRLLAIMAVLTGMTFFAAADDADDSGLTVGARGIIHWGVGSYLEDDWLVGFGASSETTTGFGGALFAKCDFLQGLGAQLELEFMHNPIDADFFIGNATKKGTVSCNTLTVPILLTYDAPVGNSATITPFAGPSFAFILGDPKGKIGDKSEDFEPDSSVFFGAIAGIGMSIKAGPGDVVLDLRYNFTFNDLESNDLAIAHFETLQLGAGYQIRF